jgi:CDGSH iron-sulfur domain-containing protein 3
MSEATIAQKSPYNMTLVEGQYYWCACGESANQPFCDGSHKKQRLFTPIQFEVTENKEVWLCGCKHSNNQPFCDGTHKTL